MGGLKSAQLVYRSIGRDALFCKSGFHGLRLERRKVHEWCFAGDGFYPARSGGRGWKQFDEISPRKARQEESESKKGWL